MCFLLHVARVVVRHTACGAGGGGGAKRAIMTALRNTAGGGGAAAAAPVATATRSGFHLFG